MSFPLIVISLFSLLLKDFGASFAAMFSSSIKKNSVLVSYCKCQPPWWRTLLGGAPMDLAEREQCEEREMSACLVASKESCLKFAKDKCLSPFHDARIALTDQKTNAKLLKSGACNLEVANCRGSDILSSGVNI
ncbi:hypothetical protein MKW94_001383 [Papaver nudicaule]|uniref:Uncharacterized protein n=1 Tax=Papaver nudicaule TaxID=74823 RepID=A0AA41VU42_PAPNU|nr:hypothetical protein [Papaver nudicaule]